MTETPEHVPLHKLPWSAYLAWCKKDALRYLPEDPKGAVQAMSSDIHKFEGENGPTGEVVAMLCLTAAMGRESTDPEAARRWIEGWN